MVISNLDHVEVVSETVMVEGAGKKYKKDKKDDKYGKKYGYGKKKYLANVNVAVAVNVSTVTQVAIGNFGKKFEQVAFVEQFAAASAG
jgi:hypothetical protein